MKRIFDILVASAGLILLAPVLVAIALAIRVTMGSPILFRQLRPGKDGRPLLDGEVPHHARGGRRPG
jgi:lipopolysaccharide/colanic/teichoic acid biosynthesis glycosyltransferase